MLTLPDHIGWADTMGDRLVPQVTKAYVIIYVVQAYELAKCIHLGTGQLGYLYILISILF